MCFMLVHRRSVDKQKTHKHKIAPAAGEFLGDLQYVNKILHFQTPVSDTVCEAKSLRTAIYSLNP